MVSYIVRRSLIFIPMLLGITLITFVVANLAPGDPITAMLSPEDQLNEEDLDRMREALGLNKPIPVRYALWLGQLVQGNFGYSYFTGRPVIERVGGRIWATLELTGAALLISTVMGFLFGVLAALRQYSRWDYTLTVSSLVGLSIPTFFFALVALLVFGSIWQVMPVFGMTSSTTGEFSITDNLYHLILPASILSLDLMAQNTRYARTAMLEVLRADYITTARAKGLAEYVVMGRHAFRNALLPLITITSLRLPILLGGAIVVETMFSWPGLGLLSIDAIHQQDYPTVMGLTFFVSALVLGANLLADVLYAFADPRIRYA